MRRLLCRILGGHTIDPDPGDFVLRCTRCGHIEDLPPAREAWLRLLDSTGRLVAEGPTVLIETPGGLLKNAHPLSFPCPDPTAVTHIEVHTDDGVKVMPVEGEVTSWPTT